MMTRSTIALPRMAPKRSAPAEGAQRANPFSSARAPAWSQIRWPRIDAGGRQDRFSTRFCPVMIAHAHGWRTVKEYRSMPLFSRAVRSVSAKKGLWRQSLFTQQAFSTP